jgi:pyruvate/2-oxoglutarate dehydrogenase complex dihydrolipoamide acyltransferase (E2) component
MREVLMPRLSDEEEEGVLVTWFVQPGATVREGDLLAEVQVLKVSAEVVAPASGTVELRAQPGDVVPQGAVIAVIREPEEAPAAVPASPAARRLARELGVDLSAVRGTGPGGRIVEEDVRRAAGGAAPGAPAPVEPISPMRRAIAERLHGHLAATAQVTLTAEADVTALAQELERLSAASGRRASYTEAAVRAVALALREHPRLGGRWTEEGIVLPDRLDVGVAVALDEGLVVPVIRAVDTKDLQTLGQEIAELAERARKGALTPADLEGGVFSVTNLGAYGVDAFTPLLNPPQSAILGLGRARPRPAAVEGRVEVRTLMVLSLTFDHRVVDGAPAAAFLRTVVSLLEMPDRLVSSPG